MDKNKFEELEKAKSAVEELEDQLGYNESIEKISLRDYFAGQALCGLMSNSEGNRNWTEEDWATLAYKQSDAMLAARNKILTSPAQNS